MRTTRQAMSLLHSAMIMDLGKGDRAFFHNCFYLVLMSSTLPDPASLAPFASAKLPFSSLRMRIRYCAQMREKAINTCKVKRLSRDSGKGKAGAQACGPNYEGSANPTHIGSLKDAIHFTLFLSLANDEAAALPTSFFWVMALPWYAG
eukprot:1151195-Pelagomonas_calceolata.AAC.4